MRLVASTLATFVCLWLAPAASSAQGAAALGAPSPKRPASSPNLALEYSDVDLGTVRVFSMRNVDLARVEGKRVMRDVAEPVAGHGSGFFVNEGGLVVTAAHVVEDRTHVAVHVFGEDEARPARVVYTDRQNDIAILQTLGPSRKRLVVPPEPPPLRVRDRVHAVGYPVDAARNDPQSSEGIVSGMLPDGRLQVSISVNPGNSGGPLVTADEALIGMIVARGNVDRGVHGIGVAVPLTRILEAVALVEKHGAHTRALASLSAKRENEVAIARTVEALVSDVAPSALREVWTSADDAPLVALSALERLAETATDPDLSAMLAAFFWNASLIAMERAGGHALPSQMPSGPARDLSHRAMGLAIELSHRGAERDPSLSSRSPFIRHVLKLYPRRPRKVASARR